MPLWRPSPGVLIDRRDDGSAILRSPLELPPPRRSLPHLFDEAASAHPDRVFVRQRQQPGEPWREISYAAAQRASQALAQWLIDQGLGEGDSLAVLSPASIEHAIIALGALRAGVAVAPVSPAYSLLSSDHVKLRACLANARARFAFADDAARYGRALSAIGEDGVRVITPTGAPGRAASFEEIVATAPGPEVAARMAAIRPETIARIMHTAGSTGAPKATPQSQANLMVTVAQMEAVGLLDFGGEAIHHLEAMPFHHIMAGNFNFANVIAAAGTISLDEGKPTPELFHHTLANLREVSPHFYITVPLGYAMLCDAMEADAGLRAAFFRNLRYMGFGGASMPSALQARLEALTLRERGEPLPLFSFYGATEYLFGALRHWPAARADIIGLPLPGAQLKLVPQQGKYELRVSSPTMMPRSGYLGAPEAAAGLFDEEGFFRTGDLVEFADPDDPAEGLLFAGRLADDFKLSSGTFVLVNALRLDLLAACSPWLREVVICGADEDVVGVLLWADPAASHDLANLRRTAEAAIRAFNARQTGSARRIGAALLMAEPLSFDAHELTDKGNASPRVVRERRAADVARLFERAGHPDVMSFRPEKETTNP
jgi:feruloyl-CoA synthase